MKKRLSKTLAAAGIASRRACEEIIFSGRVSVNGETAYLPQMLVDPTKDKILVDGQKIKSEEAKVYFLLNKPSGFLCASIAKGKKVIDLFTHLPHRLFTVGRLDKDTTGLLIVTNDGKFANRIIHPSFNVTKEYLARTGQEITSEHLKKISEGTKIEGVHIRPLSVTKVRRGTLKVEVAEGKKHEVRLLLEQAGLTVKELMRIRIGPLTLGNLPLGHYRPLSDGEIKSFL